MTENANFNATCAPDIWRQGVTIGIPLYNEEPHIEAAIRSAAPQCEVLLVSDNCSTDRSADICQALAKEYSNLVFVRHARNQGATNNFQFVMTEAATPYFMWLGAHDLIPPDYVKCLRELIERDSTALLAYCAVTHVDRYGRAISHHDYPFSNQLAEDEPARRFHAIIKYLGDCSLIHGLFRTGDLKSAWLSIQYLWGNQVLLARGGDHVLLAKLAVVGRFLYTSSTLFLRRDVHLDDSPAKQLERITGLKKRPSSSLAPYQEMQRSRYALAVNEFGNRGWRSSIFCFNVRYWLIVRFGPFHESWTVQLVEMLVYQLARPVRLCSRVTSRILRKIVVDKR